MDKAVALLYDDKRGGAPRVVASGKGPTAARIIAGAHESGVQIVADPDLVELLARVPVGVEIPAELYRAVAEVLAFVYRVNGKYGERTAEAEVDSEAAGGDRARPEG